MSGVIGNLGKQIGTQIIGAGSTVGRKPATVYLTHVKWVTGKEQLTKYFGKFGQIERVSMFFVSWLCEGANLQDAETGLHRGFASITFWDTSSALAAIQTRPHVIDGDLVDVEPHVPMKTKKKSVEFAL